MQQGLDEDLYLQVGRYHDNDAFTAREKLAIEFAERFAVDHQGIEDELFDRLHAHFSDEEILDLTLCLAIWLGLGRALSVLDIEQQTGVIASL